MRQVGNKYLNTIVFCLCVIAACVPHVATGMCYAVFGFDDALIILTVAAVMAATAETAATLQQKKQDKANAKIAEANAREAMRHAENIDLQADQERLQLRLKAQQAAGKQRVTTAASGVMLGSGTSNAQAADIASAFDLDMKNLNYDIASRVWQQQMKSAEFQNQANAYKTSARNANKKIAYIWGKAALSIAGGWAGGAAVSAIAPSASVSAVAAGQAIGAGIGEMGTDLFAASRGLSAGRSANTETLVQYHSSSGNFKDKSSYGATLRQQKASAALNGPQSSKSIPSLN